MPLFWTTKISQGVYNKKRTASKKVTYEIIKSMHTLQMTQNMEKLLEEHI